MCTGGDHHRVVLLLDGFEQLAVDRGVGLDLDADLLDAGNLGFERVRRETVGGDDLAQLAADLGIRLVDGDRMPLQFQLPGGA